MLCHYYCTTMLLLLGVISSHFELANVSSMTEADWKRKTENGLHLVALFTFKCCCLQRSIKLCSVCFSFIVRNTVSTNLNYHDIIWSYITILYFECVVLSSVCSPCSLEFLSSLSLNPNQTERGSAGYVSAKIEFFLPSITKCCGGNMSSVFSLLYCRVLYKAPRDDSCCELVLRIFK